MDAEVERKASILIVYYSRTGTTRRAAEMLGAVCAAPLVEVRATRAYDGALGLLRAAREAVTGHAPPVETDEHDPAGFDVAVLAAPVWVGKAASPMRGYIERHRARLPRVAFLCTHHGGGAAGAFRAMEAACGREPVATLSLTARDLRPDGATPDGATPDGATDEVRPFATALLARAGETVSSAAWPAPRR